MPHAKTILIPGLLCDAHVWQPLLQKLGDKAIVADLSTQDSISQMARDSIALAHGPVFVVGHSMGARVAMEIARIAPDRVKKLALLDTGIHPLSAGEPEKRAEVVRLANESGMQALAERWLPGMVWQENHSNKTLMDGLMNMVLSKTPELHQRQIKALVERPDASAYLHEIKCPTLLIVGRYDNWSPVSQHQDMLALLPDARLEIIEEAGHFSPLEQPDRVSDLLQHFLAS